MFSYFILSAALLSANGNSAGVQESCGITKVAESSLPAYPPMARAAHVTGDVTVQVTFNPDGVVAQNQIISGPEMLKLGTRDFVSGWHANSSEGSRSCLLTVTYVLNDEVCNGPAVAKVVTGPTDLQHYTIAAAGGYCEDLSVRRRRRFLGIF